MRRILASLLMVVMVLFAARAASADLIMVLEGVTVDYSADAQQGSFEIYVTSDLSPSPKLVGYQMELVSEDPRITFVGYDKPTSRPYLLDGGHLWKDAAEREDEWPAAKFLLGDGFFMGNRALVDGAGIARVDFTIAAGAPAGSYAIELGPNSFVRYDDGGSGSPLSFEVQGGTVTIVPEPQSVALLLGGVVLVAPLWLVRRRRSHAATRGA